MNGGGGVMLSVAALNVIMLSIVMLDVIMLSVVAPVSKQRQVKRL